MSLLLSFSLLLPLLFLCICRTARAADIVAVLPDRSTAYPNGVHNGLLLTAHRLNLTVQIHDVGNFDPEKSAQVLTSLIQLESKQQPKIYCIWPIDIRARELLAELYKTHKVPIIQMNQLPGQDNQWEWKHLLGYAGPDDALRASNAGIMMIQAMQERNIAKPNIVALGYPHSYGGYHLSIAAFEDSIGKNPEIALARKLPLDWGTQPAYEAVLQLLDEMGDSLHGIYAMDDYILLGAHQALQDHPHQGNVSLVGTVCNGARKLLETREQYGTTVQAPYLEGDLAIRTAHEYLTTGNLTEPRIRFTPNPIVTADTWPSMLLDFQGQSYTADDLCTWSLFQDRVAGIESVDTVQDVCQIIDCSFIPTYLKVTGYVLCSINYTLAIISAILLFWFQDKAVISLAQPFFLGLVCLGAVIDNTSIIFMGFDNTDNVSDSFLDAACMTFPWLLSLGHMMTTATLVAKIYRIKKLVGATSSQRGLRKAKVTVQEVAAFIVGFLSIDVVLMLAWTLYDPLQWTIQVSDTDQAGYIASAYGQCSSQYEHSYLFPLFIALIHLGTLIYANILAYQTSAYHQISDSKSIAIALFNSIQLLVIVTPLLVVVDDNVATSYLIRVCFVFLNNFGVLALVVVPKLWACLIGLGDATPDLHRITTEQAASRGVLRGSRISGLEDVHGSAASAGIQATHDTVSSSFLSSPKCGRQEPKETAPKKKTSFQLPATSWAVANLDDMSGSEESEDKCKETPWNDECHKTNQKTCGCPQRHDVMGRSRFIHLCS